MDIIKKRFTICVVPASHGCVGVVTKQPSTIARSVTPSQFVRPSKPQRVHVPLIARGYIS